MLLPEKSSSTYGIVGIPAWYSSFLSGENKKSLCHSASDTRETMSFYSLEFDGASRGNPGHAGAAAYLFKVNNGHKDCVWFDSEYLGSKTNNQAEYSALILGLKECVNRAIMSLEVCGDSELVFDS